MILEKIIFTLLFKWKYLIAILHSKFLKKNKNSVFTSITYVAREADKDWIFGAKVRRLAKFSGLDSNTYFHNRLRTYQILMDIFLYFINTFIEQCVIIQKF